VMEERAIWIFLYHLGDGFYRVIGERVGRVVVAWKGCDALIVVSEDARFAAFVIRVGLNGIEEITATIEESVELLESAVVGVGGFTVTQVPLAGEGGGVSSILHDFAQGDHIGFEEFASAAWPQSSDNRGPRRGALGVIVELGEAHAFARETVEVGRLDFAPVATDVAPSHVVYHDQNDVRSGGMGRDRESGEGEKGE